MFNLLILYLYTCQNKREDNTWHLTKTGLGLTLSCTRKLLWVRDHLFPANRQMLIIAQIFPLFPPQFIFFFCFLPSFVHLFFSLIRQIFFAFKKISSNLYILLHLKVICLANNFPAFFYVFQLEFLIKHKDSRLLYFY